MYHCVKIVRFRSYSVRMWENMDQNNSAYGYFSHTVSLYFFRVSTPLMHQFIYVFCLISIIAQFKNQYSLGN